MKFLRKLAATLVLLICIVVVVAYLGTEMIKSSTVYEASRLELQKQYMVNSANLSIKYLMPFSFSEGASDGHAKFVLCDKDAVCYQIDAQKKSGVWHITTAKR